jgi:hypothetical protein
VSRVPFIDLRAQYRSIKADIDAAVQRVLEGGQFALGPAVSSFEQAFAAYCGTQQAVGVNSGTSALHLALLAAGVSPGDEVITVPFTFIATVAAIEYAGAKPVFVDVDDTYCTMDPARLEAAGVHLEMSAILKSMRRTRQGQADAAEKCYAMLKAGRVPTGDHDSLVFWQLVIAPAEPRKDADAFAKGMETLKKLLADDPKAQKFLAGLEGRLDQLRKTAPPPAETPTPEKPE